MIPAPLPENEEQRLAKLYELDIMDSLEEQAYDDITHLAASICGTPIALISLIDKERQFLKSHHGLDANEVSRELGFCPHAILDNDVTVVEDATQDERFFDNPLVTGGPTVRFYAGAPLIMEGDLRVGTLCVVSDKPRSISAEEAATLEALARQVVSQLELRRSIKALEYASKAKSEFMSSMSHELRTPMNAILGFAQLLEHDTKTPLSDRHRSYVAHIMTGGNHLLELIGQVLELNKIEAGKITLDIENVSLNELIAECISFIENRAGESGIEVINKTINSGPLELTTDRTRLTQALLNLLSNAVKYNKVNGKITVSCQVSADHRLTINVTDTGLGIPDTAHEDVFKPFERLNQHAGNIEGTGIGLTITRQLIELLGGTVGFDSEVGTGSTFWLELPLKQSPTSNLLH